MTQSKTKSWLPNLVFCSSSHFMNQCCCTDVKEKQNLRTYLFDVEWEVLKTFDGVKSWPVQMQIKTRNNNFVFDFWFLFLLTFYGDILSYGCEKKTKLTKVSFWCKMGGSKNIWDIRKMACTDAYQIKKQELCLHFFVLVLLSVFIFSEQILSTGCEKNKTHEHFLLWKWRFFTQYVWVFARVCGIQSTIFGR